MIEKKEYKILYVVDEISGDTPWLIGDNHNLEYLKSEIERLELRYGLKFKIIEKPQSK